MRKKNADQDEFGIQNRDGDYASFAIIRFV